jgi:hypothetical protein
LIRLSAVLFGGLMIGHMSAYPWTSSHVARQVNLVDQMSNIPFEFTRERSTYGHWDADGTQLAAAIQRVLADGQGSKDPSVSMVAGSPGFAFRGNAPRAARNALSLASTIQVE